MAFRGTFDHTLDAKNRLTIPAKFRASLSDGVVLSKGIEPCVQIWTPPEYDAYVETVLQGQHPLSEPARRMRRWLSANSLDLELDAAGRVMLPGFLIEHAGLEREVVVTGATECLEVWSRATWADYNEALSHDARDIASRIGDPA